jgi:hypothetical protein
MNNESTPLITRELVPVEDELISQIKHVECKLDQAQSKRGMNDIEYASLMKYVKECTDDNKRLSTLLAEREATIKKMSEEINILKNK